MSDDKPNWTARTALAVSILSALFTAYFNWFQGPDIQIGLGQYVLINSKPRIGVLCTLANKGAGQAVITRGQLNWGSQQPLPATMVSSKLEEWTFGGKGERIAAGTSTYTLFAPIAIKGHDQQSTILWFTPEDPNLPWKFERGRHELRLSLSGVGKTWSTHFGIELTDIDVSNVHGVPFSEFTVKVIEDQH